MGLLDVQNHLIRVSLRTKNTCPSLPESEWVGQLTLLVDQETRPSQKGRKSGFLGERHVAPRSHVREQATTSRQDAMYTDVVLSAKKINRYCTRTYIYKHMFIVVPHRWRINACNLYPIPAQSHTPAWPSERLCSSRAALPSEHGPMDWGRPLKAVEAKVRPARASLLVQRESQMVP